MQCSLLNFCNRGVLLVIDDVSTGYVGFLCLVRLWFDIVKLDHGLVVGV